MGAREGLDKKRTGVLLNRADGTEGLPLPLESGGNLTLYASWHYDLIEDPINGPWRTTTKAYLYYLEAPDGSAIVDFHWHPYEGQRFPHAHVGPVGLSGSLPMPDDGLVFPTVRIPFEFVIRLAIEQLGAIPDRADWDGTLTRLEGLFRKYRTWAIDPGLDT